MQIQGLIVKVVESTRSSMKLGFPINFVYPLPVHLGANRYLLYPPPLYLVEVVAVVNVIFIMLFTL